MDVSQNNKLGKFCNNLESKSQRVNMIVHPIFGHHKGKKKKKMSFNLFLCLCLYTWDFEGVFFYKRNASKKRFGALLQQSPQMVSII